MSASAVDEAPEPPEVRHVLPIAKHPVVRLMPLAKVEVPVPPVVTGPAKVEVAPLPQMVVVEVVPTSSGPFAENFEVKKLVVVALVVVEFCAVKFWNVDEAVARIFWNTAVVPVMKVEKKFVEVAWVVVERSISAKIF